MPPGDLLHRRRLKKSRVPRPAKKVKSSRKSRERFSQLRLRRLILWRQQKGLANSDHGREIKDNSIGLSSIDEGDQRKLNSPLIYLEGEGENYIAIEKPNNEPEPDQIQSCEVSNQLNIDNDVIGEIMCRASWREISVLKCVSKQFANPTCAADFLLQLRKKGNKEPNLLAGIFYHVKRLTNGNKITYQARFIPMSKWSNKLYVDELKNRGLNALKITQCLPLDFEIQECRHGLLLCTCKVYRFITEADQNHQIDGYYVCNPIMRKDSWLPMPPESSHNYWQTAFMVDKENGHYQVVKIPSTYHHSENPDGDQESFTDVEVYSSLLRCWRTRKYRVVYHDQYCFDSRCPFIAIFRNYVMERPTVEIGNSLYWINEHHFGHHSETKNSVGYIKIVCCNIEKEMIEFINHPDFSQSSWVRSLCIGKYQGMLHYALQCDDTTILLWRLENGGWKFLKEIHCFQVPLGPLHLFMTLSGDNFELYALDQERIFLKNSGKIVCYNFVSNMEETHMSYDEDLIFGYKAVMPYLLPKMPLPVF